MWKMKYALIQPLVESEYPKYVLAALLPELRNVQAY
jgi:hypothetical protein